jgi:hypothetical protein
MTTAAAKAKAAKSDLAIVPESPTIDTPSVTLTEKGEGIATANDQRKTHNDAVKRSQAARKDAVNMLVAAHAEEFAGYWATTKAAHGISDRAAKREQKERAEYERLMAKFATQPVLDS